MSADLTTLRAYDEEGALRVIVESPRQSSLKLKYEPTLQMFTVSRELPLGVVYPFDWGFIPGTRGDDGDPIDAMAIHRTPTYPGVLLPCRVLGMVEVIQREGKGPPAINNRVITTPSWGWHSAARDRRGTRPSLTRASGDRAVLRDRRRAHRQAAQDQWMGNPAPHRKVPAATSRVTRARKNTGDASRRRH